MPLTWFAHQVPVVGLKIARPRRIDATAACVGSMMPDLMYSFSAYIDIDTHEWLPAIAIGLPISLLIAAAVRRVVAPGGVPFLPDLGSFRLRSWAVLAERRPWAVLSMLSAVLGIATHIVLDWFTHPGRPGARALGYDDASVTVFGHTEPIAGVLQLIGHSFGSLVGIWLFWLIGRRRLLEQWYSDGLVDRARLTGRTISAAVFWVAVCGGTCLGMAWGLGGERVEMIQRTFVGCFAGLLAASGLAVGARRRAPTVPLEGVG